MFELSELRQTRVYQEAREEGKREGKREGRKEGKQAGKREGKLETVSLLLNLGLSVEQIAAELGLDVRAVRKVAQKQAGS